MYVYCQPSGRLVEEGVLKGICSAAGVTGYVLLKVQCRFEAKLVCQSLCQGLSLQNRSLNCHAWHASSRNSCSQEVGCQLVKAGSKDGVLCSDIFVKDVHNTDAFESTHVACLKEATEAYYYRAANDCRFTVQIAIAERLSRLLKISVVTTHS